MGWSATDFWVPEIVSCGSVGLGVLNFVNGGADTVCGIVLFFFLCISAACFFVGIMIGMPYALFSVLAWAAGGYQGLIS